MLDVLLDGFCLGKMLKSTVSVELVGITWESLGVSGAGEGNRTLVISLEGCCSTIELHPQRAHTHRPLTALGQEGCDEFSWWHRTALRALPLNLRLVCQGAVPRGERTLPSSPKASEEHPAWHSCIRKAFRIVPETNRSSDNAPSHRTRP
jgi:hypothetical protein